MAKAVEPATLDELIKAERAWLTHRALTPYVDDYRKHVEHIILGRIDGYWQEWTEGLRTELEKDPLSYFKEHKNDLGNFREFIGDMRPFEDACQVAENRYNPSMGIPEDAVGNYLAMLRRIVKYLNGKPELHGLKLVVGRQDETDPDDVDHAWVRIV